MKEFTEAIIMMLNAGIITIDQARELYFRAVEVWMTPEFHHYHSDEDEEEFN